MKTTTKKTISRGGLAAAILMLGLAQPASAHITTFTGDTRGGPTFDRPPEDRWDWPFLPPVADVAYRAYDVHVLATQSPVNFATTCSFDCSMYIYTGTFDPLHPTDRFLFADGNYVSWATAVFGGPLDAGHYTIVVTGEDKASSGFFSTTISGPGAFTVTPLAPVPEPSGWLMLGAGLAGLGLRRRPNARS
jgi:hypothetical protein